MGWIESKVELVERMETDKHIPSVTRVLNVLNWYKTPSKLPEIVMDRLRDRGTIIHDYVDKDNRGKEYNVDLIFQIFVDYFQDWKKDYNPEIIASELYVFNGDIYRGILDMIVIIDGKTYVVDLKISSSYIPLKADLQMSAYAVAVEQSYNIQVDGIAMLRISKTGYEWVATTDRDQILQNYKKFEELIPMYKELKIIWDERERKYRK